MKFIETKRFKDENGATVIMEHDAGGKLYWRFLGGTVRRVVDDSMKHRADPAWRFTPGGVFVK